MISTTLITIVTLLVNNTLFAGADISNFDKTGFFEIKNEYVGRIFSTKDGHLRTVKITNYKTGDNYTTSSREFLLRFDSGLELTTEDFKIANHYAENRGDGMQRLTFELESHKTSLKVAVVYETSGSWHYIRKYLLLEDNENSTIGLTFLDAEKLTVENEGKPIPKTGLWDNYPENINPLNEEDLLTKVEVIPQIRRLNIVDGQPVYTDNLFWGIEHPAAINTVDESGNLVLRFYMGRDLGNTYQSGYSVLGGSDFKGVKESFLTYIDKIRVQQNDPFVALNTWFLLRNLNHKNTMEAFNHLREDLLKPYGIKLDAFVLDLQWDNYLSMWEPDIARFPFGFDSVKTYLNNHGTSLGLWVTPAGVYTKRVERMEWAKTMGYETTGKEWSEIYCLAGEKYKEAFLESMKNLVEKYGVNYFKFDSFEALCDNPDHGHRTGIASRAAIVDNYIDILKSLKTIKPDIFLNITCGTWLSPWWLKYSDSVWRDSDDTGYLNKIPFPTPRDAAITYVDYALYKKLKILEEQFPINALYLIEFVKGKHNLLGGQNEHIRQWADHVILSLARGVRLWELQISPDILSEKEWEVLSDVIKWGLENKDILRNSRMILGNPAKGEIYGYSHWNKNEGLLVLRNPSYKKQYAAIPLNKEIYCFIDSDTEWVVKTEYPYNEITTDLIKPRDTLLIPVESFETKIVRLVSGNELKEPAIPGATYKTKTVRIIQPLEEEIIIDSEKGLKIVTYNGKISIPEDSFLEARFEAWIEGKDHVHDLSISLRDKNGSKLFTETWQDSKSASSSEKPSEDDILYSWHSSPIKLGLDKIQVIIKVPEKIKFKGKTGIRLVTIRKATNQGEGVMTLKNAPTKTCQLPSFDEERKETTILLYKEVNY